MKLKFPPASLFILLSFISAIPRPACPERLPDTLWTRTYGGPDQEDCRQVAGYLGGYAICGRTRSYGAGNVDVYVLRLAPNGDTLWTRTFGTAFNDGGAALCPTADTCVCVSYTSAFNTGNPDGHLVKLDPAGAVLWSKVYGGLSGEAVYSVAQAPDLGFIMTGSARGDAFLLKTDAAGDTSWIRYYGGSGSEMGYAVRVCADRGYAFCGTTDSYGAGASDAWLVKTDSLGNEEFIKTYGGPSDDIAWQFQPAPDGGYCLAGETWSFGPGTPDYSNLYLIKTGPQGDTLWTRAYGGSMGDAGYSLLASSGAKFLACGYTESGGFGAADLWLLEINAMGDTVSAKIFGGPADDKGAWILTAPDSGYAMAGTTGSFGNGGNDIWLLKTGRDTMAVLEKREKTALSLTAYPNPCRDRTIINLGLPGGDQERSNRTSEPRINSIELRVYDINGGLIRVLPLGPMPYALSLDGSDRSGDAVPPGVYFLVGQAQGYRETVKIVYLGGSR